MIRKIDSNIFSLTILKVTTFSRIRQDAEIKRLRKALELEKLRSKAFSTMIDLAEETFNIPVRKKSGTKQ